MSSLPDAERDACDVIQALEGLAALLARPQPDGGERPAETDEARRMMVSLVQGGGDAAQRVAGYLRALRGAGDGESAAVPSRLGPWRDWVPPRGDIFGRARVAQRIGDGPRTRRADPGE